MNATIYASTHHIRMSLTELYIRSLEMLRLECSDSMIMFIFVPGLPQVHVRKYRPFTDYDVMEGG